MKLSRIARSTDRHARIARSTAGPWLVCVMKLSVAIAWMKLSAEEANLEDCPIHR